MPENEEAEIPLCLLRCLGVTGLPAQMPAHLLGLALCISPQRWAPVSKHPAQPVLLLCVAEG